MKSIQVNSLPFGEVIRDIANALETSYSEHCEESVVTLPTQVGKGVIRGINFEGGMGIIQYDCTFNQDIEIQYIVNNIHPLKFLYCIDGTLEHRFEKDNGSHYLKQYQSAIIASEQFRGHILKFPAKTNTRIISLEIDRAAFMPKIACELQSMKPEQQQIFLDLEARSAIYHDGFYSLQLADLFKELQAYGEDLFLRKLLMEGKAYQMLTMQIRLYQDDLEDTEHRYLLRQSEVKLIQKAEALIREEIATLETIDVIAARVGLNIRKLQEGFQYLYHQSVNTYIQGVRMQLARELLPNIDYSIADIADLIGLSSKSYFSKIFKEAYGTTPSGYRQNFFQIRRNNNKSQDN